MPSTNPKFLNRTLTMQPHDHEFRQRWAYEVIAGKTTPYPLGYFCIYCLGVVEEPA